MTGLARERVLPARSIIATAVTLLATLLLVPLVLASRAEAFIYGTGSGDIGRANLDGTGVDDMFIASLDHPLDIAVDASTSIGRWRPRR